MVSNGRWEKTNFLTQSQFIKTIVFSIGSMVGGKKWIEHISIMQMAIDTKY